MNASTETTEVKLILSFLDEIGIAVVERELTGITFVPGLALGPNCIYMDKTRMLYPGDLLHEAGHLAVTEAKWRSKIGSPEMYPEWPEGGDEMGAILWSYAALTHIGIAPEIVFHPNGYKNEAEWLIETLNSKLYIGMPFLEWIGLALDEPKAKQLGQPAFPKMLKWLRD
ncbi:MAG: hypothetical protein JWP12_2564 [Bacteroidetes bacterium]|nr:hypothetical protein [Bacteroidota bacterium]